MIDMRPNRAAEWGAAAILIASLAAASRAELPVLTLITDVVLPAPAARFDDQSFDPVSMTIYVARRADGGVLLFNTQTRSVVARLSGFPAVTGVLAVPEIRRLFVSAAGKREVAVVDTDTLKVVARIPAGDSPEGLAYSPDTGKVFVSDARGRNVTVLDARGNRKLSTIDLGGEAGRAQYDAGSKRILATVRSRNELVEIDPAAETIVGRHALPGGSSPRGLLVVASKRLAFVVCEASSKLLVVDLERFRVKQVLPTADGSEVLAFDPGLGRLYVAGASGVVSAFQLVKAFLGRLEDVRVAPGAHLIAVNPQNHLVYLPIDDVEGRPVMRIMKPTGR